ncbi:TetR/AcrR family transcriptional regulator [Microbacterium sp. NPDC058389]|uniref:TetR/AcrR family transcriptional regulator n=1 Tax=Microbacterium sp. NPDC058389 TaxID=3346475 RepID=UPI0036653C65
MNADSAESHPAGRRERNKDAKRAAIFDAAATLFEAHGFAAVTTQQIAEHADVAAGTVFRYASSKAELLLMVYNVEFERAVARGQDAAVRHAAREAAVTALLAPLLEWGSTHAENTLAYQRELLFGTANERYRAEGLELAADLVARIAAIITRPEPSGDDALQAARSVFGALHLALIEVATGVWHIADPVATLSTQVRQIIAGADRVARHPDDHGKEAQP